MVVKMVVRPIAKLSEDACHVMTQGRQRIEWVRDYNQALTPYTEPGGYITFMQDDDYDKIQDN
jgi:hypothetical protein